MSEETNSEETGGFVTGTLIHMQEGLKPMEQIKEGDWILSKSESGEGGLSYKRVLKTFEYSEREVWFLGYVLMENGQETSDDAELLVVTPTHTIWVKELRDADGELSKNVSKWVRADKLLDDYLVAGEYPIFELQDGRSARLSYAGPVLRVANPDHGLVCDLGNWLSESSGLRVDFSSGHPRMDLANDGSPVLIEMDLEPADNYDETDHQSMVARTNGYYPLLRKVFKLKVEDNRPYFVGQAGVLVR